MTVLVTGGAGYIGSHTCVELLKEGYEVVIVDNLSNSKSKSLERVREITGKNLFFYKVDIRDKESLKRVFDKHVIDAVIHFAGYKSVEESVKNPLKYYGNNIYGTLVLLDVMKEYKVNKIVFSSSATVYGAPKQVPISENSPLSVTNPYGRTKLLIEEILHDIYASDQNWKIIILRYFNPIGAHSSGLIGEDPNGIPDNLMPYITQVAIGKLNELRVFGNDYPTVDGTGVRDYIHVVDLAKGHLKSIIKLKQLKGINIYNLGTGRGYSVLEVIKSFEKVTGKKIPYKFVNKRPGDVAICYADVDKAKNELDWTAKRGIEEMCADAWRWQVNNPNGY